MSEPSDDHAKAIHYIELGLRYIEYGVSMYQGDQDAERPTIPAPQPLEDIVEFKSLL